MFGFNMHWMLAHLCGDFLLQNDFMALNKKGEVMELFGPHILLYDPIPVL